MTERRLIVPALLVAVLLGLSLSLSAQDKAPEPILTLDRIFGSREFAAERFGPARWKRDGESYTTLEPSAEAKGRARPRPLPGRDGEARGPGVRGQARPARRL